MTNRSKRELLIITPATILEGKKDFVRIHSRQRLSSEIRTTLAEAWLSAAKRQAGRTTGHLPWRGGLGTRIGLGSLRLEWL